MSESFPLEFTRTPLAYPDGVPSFVDAERPYGKVERQTIWNVLSLAKAEGWRTVAQADVNSPAKRHIDVQVKTSFLELIGIPPGQRVLDLAAGWGSLPAQIAKRYRGTEVHAFDKVLEGLLFLNIVREQERLSDLHLGHVEPWDIPIADESVDVVLYIGALERVGESTENEDPMVVQLKVLHEVKRVLRNGGKAVIGVENRFSYRYLMGKRDSSGRRFGAILPQRGRIRMYTESGYRGLFKQKAGFKSVETFFASPNYRLPRAISSPANIRRLMVASQKDEGQDWIRVTPDWLLRRVVPCFYFVLEK